jgi:predicted AlkP superfamily pyrophosphatase or phosphodiesterase
METYLRRPLSTPLGRFAITRTSTAFSLLPLIITACSGSGGTKEATGKEAFPPTVILLALDGVHPRDVSWWRTPALARLARDGVQAQALFPVFPTKSVPNLRTIVTGLYPEHHESVANEYFDVALGRAFTGSAADATDTTWWRGETMWMSAERAGARSAVVFWPGAEAAVESLLPSVSVPYDGSVGDSARIQRVLDEIDKSEDRRPRLLLAYITTVDQVKHQFGPRSLRAIRAARQADHSVGILLDGLAQRQLTDKVHVLVVSDHGMAAVDPDRIIRLPQQLDRCIDRAVWGVVSHVWPRPGCEDVAYETLRRVHSRVHAYRRGDIPERWRYRAGPRIPPVLAVAEEGWTLASANGQAAALSWRGNHGYDDTVSSMQGIFIGRGPGLMHGAKVAGFRNVHIYSLVMHLLQIPPAITDGTLDSVRFLLRAPTNSTRER